MSDTVAVSVMQPDEVEAVGNLIAQALHFQSPAGEMVAWMEKRGIENFRVARVDGERAGALVNMPMGQWFGGVAVPTAAIAGVGIAPEFRGRKVGAALMTAMLSEQRELGVPLSTLYPATTQFYRTLGYERAGSRTVYQVGTRAMTVREREVRFRRSGVDERELIEGLYNAWVSNQNGPLQRSAVMWERVFKTYTGVPLVYIIEQAGRPVGYLSYLQGKQQEEVRVIDWCALTAAAARGIVQFFYDHRTMASEVLWPGAPSDVLLYVLPEEQHKVHWKLDWMLRITDVAQALMARGYSAAVQAEVHFDVHDAVLPENAGRWVLQLRDGKANVERGGTGAITLDVRDLAALYASYLDPFTLRIAGALNASAADLETLRLIFGGPRPWMPDMF